MIEEIELKFEIEQLSNRLDAIERALVRLEAKAGEALHNTQIVLGQYETTDELI